MPIVINRNTGAVKPQKITQEQRDALWGELLRNYIHFPGAKGDGE